MPQVSKESNNETDHRPASLSKAWEMLKACSLWPYYLIVMTVIFAAVFFAGFALENTLLMKCAFSLAVLAEILLGLPDIKNHYFPNTKK